jgi:hypothetical protein
VTDTGYFFEAAKAISREHAIGLGLPDPFPGEPRTELDARAREELDRAMLDLAPVVPPFCDRCGSTRLIVGDRHARCAHCGSDLVVLR